MSAATSAGVEELLRVLAPHILGALARRYGHFDACEDAVQEALLAAALHWPAKGVPEQPRGWLIRVAARRLIDQLRAETARSRREATAAALMTPAALVTPGADERSPADQDDSLTLLSGQAADQGQRPVVRAAARRRAGRAAAGGAPGAVPDLQ